MSDERKQSQIRWLATKVMGWEPYKRGEWFDTHEGHASTIRLDSWADAGMVWERAREMEVRVILAGDMDTWEAEVYPEGGWIGLVCHAVSGPRAICEAVAKATGFLEETNETS